MLSEPIFRAGLCRCRRGFPPLFPRRVRRRRQRYLHGCAARQNADRALCARAAAVPNAQRAADSASQPRTGLYGTERFGRCPIPQSHAARPVARCPQSPAAGSGGRTDCVAASQPCRLPGRIQPRNPAARNEFVPRMVRRQRIGQNAEFRPTPPVATGHGNAAGRDCRAAESVCAPRLYRPQPDADPRPPWRAGLPRRIVRPDNV